MHILLLMTWLLPLAAPVLVVWVRTLAGAGLTTPFDGDHSVFSAAPFLVLVTYSSCMRAPLFQMQSFERTVSIRWSLVAVSAAALLLGSRKPYLVLDTAKVALGLFVLNNLLNKYNVLHVFFYHLSRLVFLFFVDEERDEGLRRGIREPPVFIWSQRDGTTRRAQAAQEGQASDFGGHYAWLRCPSAAQEQGQELRSRLWRAFLPVRDQQQLGHQASECLMNVLPSNQHQTTPASRDAPMCLLRRNGEHFRPWRSSDLPC
uniref:GPI inositol-deacylase transmembrane domain-containing protein n=1 Tax=Mycena chlorophos TaxID=658473 RepID=A0ABQ0LUK5_MYCCL|nr:predicted protein [Mycena chlorophos]